MKELLNEQKEKKDRKYGDGLSKKRYTKDDKEQSQRFVETAKDVDADKSGEAFHEAMDSLKSGDK